MSGFATNSVDHLVRANLWDSQLKEMLLDDLMAMKYVRMIDGFTDGDTLNIPSIGQAEVQDYTEGQAVRYTAMDTGNYTFTIDQYKQSGTTITNKMKQDSYYMSELVSSFVPKQHRAIMKKMEADILAKMPDGQTAADTNTINGAYHRFVGGGTGNVIAIEDFARASYALQKANVPMTNLVAIVDPTVAYTLGTLTNIVNVSNNINMDGIVSKNFVTGMKFVANIFGFDVYTSQNLKSGLAETVNSVAVTNGVANLFFSAAPGTTMPLIGSLRQPPKVDSSYNKDLQQDEYVTTCRYGFKLFRPENAVVVITDNTKVYS